MFRKFNAALIFILTLCMIFSALVFSQPDKNSIKCLARNYQIKQEIKEDQGYQSSPFNFNHSSEFYGIKLLNDNSQIIKPPPKPQLQKENTSCWISLGPEGGWIKALLIHPTEPTTLYALIDGDPAQLYKSVNSGNTWESLSFLPDAIQSIAIDPTNSSVFYTTYGRYLYKSIDGGTTWDRSQITTDWLNSSIVKISPSNSNIIYVGAYCYNSGKSNLVVHKSSDGGGTWDAYEVLPSSYKNAYCYCFAVNPQNPDEIYIGGSYYDHEDNRKAALFKSLNGGETWEEKSTNLEYQISDIAIDPNNPNNIYACNYYNIYRSKDGGNTWLLNNGWAYAYCLAVNPQNSNVIYAGYYGSVYKSTDGGVNWSYNWEGLKGACQSLVVDYSNPNNLYYGSSTGIFKSSNTGNSWSAYNSGIVASRIAAIEKAPSDPSILYIEFDNDAVYKTLDSGNSWDKLPEFTSCGNIGAIAVDNTNPDIVFALEESG